MFKQTILYASQPSGPMWFGNVSTNNQFSFPWLIRSDCTLWPTLWAWCFYNEYMLHCAEICTVSCKWHQRRDESFMPKRQEKESGWLACTHTEKWIVCRSDKKIIHVNSHNWRTAWNYIMLWSLIYCLFFLTKMKSIVLSINISKTEGRKERNWF